MMFQHILVPLDGSPLAEQSLPVAAQLARASGSSLLLLRVADVATKFAPSLSPDPLVTRAIIESDMAESEIYLKDLTQQAILQGVPTSTAIILGNTAATILSTLDSNPIDLIVISSHGRTGFTRWALGSMAEKVARQSPVPVLVLREEKPFFRDSHADTPGALCILIPLDGSALAEAAIVPAIQLLTALAAPGKGSVHLTQVVVLPKETNRTSSDNEEIVGQAKAYLLPLVMGQPHDGDEAAYLDQSRRYCEMNQSPCEPIGRAVW